VTKDSIQKNSIKEATRFEQPRAESTHEYLYANIDMQIIYDEFCTRISRISFIKSFTDAVAEPPNILLDLLSIFNIRPTGRDDPLLLWLFGLHVVVCCRMLHPITGLYISMMLKTVMYIGCCVLYVPYHHHGFRVLVFVFEWISFIISTSASILFPLGFAITLTGIWCFIHIIIFQSRGVLFLFIHWAMFHIDMKLLELAQESFIDWTRWVKDCYRDTKPRW